MPGNRKYDSDTLSQQRKAREEFLELKKIQSGKAEAPPPPSADAVAPATVKEKSENFWFYNKWLVIGIIFVALIITISVAQCVTRTNYDLKVVLFTAKMVSSQDNELIAKYLEKYCDDVNGNGEVNVQVINCSYNENGDIQLAQTSNAKIQSVIVADPDCVLYILDDFTKARLLSVSATASLFDDNSVKFSNAFYSACRSSESYSLPENLVMYRRHKTDKQLKQDKSSAKCYSAAGKMIDRLTANQ